MPKPWPYIGPCGEAAGLCRKPALVLVLLTEDELQGIEDDLAARPASGLMAARHESQRRQAGDRHVASVLTFAE